MSTHVRFRHIASIAWLLCIVTASPVAWGDSASATGAVILTPDDPESMAYLDGPWGAPILIRVITVADLPLARQLSANAPNPLLPARQATALMSPAGTRIDVNIVEAVPPAVGSSLRFTGRDFATWQVNSDPAVTAEAELIALLQGSALRPLARSRRSSDGPTCCVTGVPVVEVVVNAGSFNRQTVPNYAIQIVNEDTAPPPPPIAGPPANGGEIGGGNTTGGGNSGPLHQPGGDGADPIGSPD